MRALLLSVGGLLIASAAHALTVDSPPEQYDHPHRNLVILEVGHFDVRRTCSKLFGRRNFGMLGRIHACTAVGDGVAPCLVILPKAGEAGISKRDRDALLRHERAHCNGWPGDHR